jgi:Transposase DDE domain
VSCLALAEALETVSHDRLTRLLPVDWSGQTLLERAIRTLFVWERGYLIIDDTVLAKPFATAIDGLAWVFSSPERKPVYGLSLGLLVWTNGALRIPLGLRLWRQGGPSKHALARELLSEARNRLRCRPDYGLFAAWDPSRRLRKRIRDDGWYFVCRLKKNRRFNSQPLRAYRRHPYWTECGWLTGGLQVLGVRSGAKYYATHRLTLPTAAGRRFYGVRAQIEDVIRVCKDQLGWSGGQVRSARAHLPQITCCLTAFCVLERARDDRHLSIYKLKRLLSFQGRTRALSALERLRTAA